ncbi:uncharacterized protein LOC122082056 [Macadamia integrifolia]|uniref:uncharacterized protein LOC122082056 n=1 Tax=Macadamia integrifolia TaxID=60698 RepID=UPI001C4EA45F|nr:uncharacterized protein LOC122082056 [Macadamia integrifolia]
MATLWVRIVLWLSYLSADTVATIALGALSHGQGQPGSTELTTLWAPFLLLHLGGPDTITAYSLEDNELWLRHFLGLVQKVGIAVYVLIRSWAYSRVSILTIFMFVPGIVKYGERTWVLRLASKEHFRDSMLDRPDPGPNYAQFMNDYDSKQAKGSRVTVGRIEDFQLEMLDEHEEAHQQKPNNPSNSIGSESNLTDAEVLPKAYEFFETFKRLFADLILSGDDRKKSREFFQDTSSRTSFKVIEVELGFIYDLLYSKAALIYSLLGLILRCISFLSIIILLVAFLTGDNHRYSNVDRIITYILFIGALILEIYAIFVLTSSDWAFLYLNKPPKILPKVQRLLRVDKLLENYYYKYSKEVFFKCKELIFKELKRKSRKVDKIEDVKDLCTSRGDGVLGYNGHLQDQLKWSLNDIEFDQSILLWHIATDLCYECDNNVSPFTELQRETSKLLSDYMLYLLIMCPFTMPKGIGQIRFRDT